MERTDAQREKVSSVLTATSLAQDEASRYNRRNILRSERMYGHGFQSPGQRPLMKAFCARLVMKPGMRILDIGSGLGGAAFYFAEQFGASVQGLDVAPAMIEISTERRVEKGASGVHFSHGDIRTTPLPERSFDLVWSRDCILYIPEKHLVWDAVRRVVAPDGQVFITDFCRRAGTVSADFDRYLVDCHYHLQDIEAYIEAMTAAGLRVTDHEDMTSLFIAQMEREQKELREARADFLRDYDQADYDYLINRWDAKLRFCRDGDLRWGLFIARSPD